MSLINLYFKENFRLEVFAAGELSGALNLYVSNATINVTVEDNVRCPTGPPSNESCHISRLYESVLGDDTYEERLYRDIFFIGRHPDTKIRNIGGDKGIWMQQGMYATNGKYEYSLMFAGGRPGFQVNALYSKLNNVRNDTSIELGVMNQYRNYYDDSINNRTDEKITVEMKPSRNEPGEFNFKLSYCERIFDRLISDERIFDGWFSQTRLIQRYVTKDLPRFLEESMKKITDDQDKMVQLLSQYV